MQLNEIKYGFKLVKIQNIKDIGATMYQYEHLKSGGLVVHLDCEDTNNTFAIAFRTIPKDSTGVCHIIEHSLLCGSKKFPLKEPFVNLLKTSVNTFLNAFTASDWTMYPFASQTPKDFDNILEIYLDAVFNPLCMLDKKPFLQEGWHYELNNIDDVPSIKGVVYNEMKGAMSSVDEVLSQATNEAMYKDSCYHHNSGGDPEAIPTLTYEDYVAFYHAHYTPENAMSFFYGKLDIEAKLKFIDEEYYSKFTKTNTKIQIIPQKPLINLNYEKEYEIGEDEDVKDNTYMSLCYGLDNYNNRETFLGMNILCDALLSSNDSPLKKALLDAKLGQNIEWRIDDDNIIPGLHIYLQKTSPSKKETFKKVLEDEVRKLVKDGIDKELLLASINHSEFKDKECDMGGMPKGLIYGMIMMQSFNYYGDLASHLEFSKYYDKFKKELNNGYFEKLLETYILNSKHQVEVVLHPSKTLGALKKKEMDEKMLALKNSLSIKEKEALVKQTKELLAYQNHVDTKKELATLPKLKLKDIPKETNYLATKKDSVNGIKAITHELNTNQIAYLRMYFDCKTLKVSDLPYLLLLKNLFLNVPTSNYTVSDLRKKVQIYLGDLNMSVNTFSTSANDYILKFKVTASALKENVNYLPKLINEVLLHSHFNAKETKTILKQIINDLKQEIILSGNSIAAAMAASHYNKADYISTHAFRGPIQYHFLQNLLDNYDHNLVNKKLKEICSLIFSKKNVLISMSGDSDTIKVLKDEMRNLKLPRKEIKEQLNITLEAPSNEALIIPSGVSYNAIGCSLETINKVNHGNMVVLSQILNYDYLWPTVRVKGGAYGCGINMARNNNVVMSSFRDPNVANTYLAYEKVCEYLANFKVSKNEFTSYIIGSLGNFDYPLSNPTLISTWDINYQIGITKKKNEERKAQVLHTKMEDIVAYGKIFKELLEHSAKYTIGNEAKIKEYNFDSVTNL